MIGLGTVALHAQEVTPRIVGGKDADSDAYSWMVGLLHADEGDRYLAQFCGGVLVHPYYVLTAAHCVEDESTLSMDILVGTDDLDFGGRRLEVAEIFTHPNYNPDTFDHDIALVRLVSPVTDIEPIGIADEESWQAVGTAAKILGWGQHTLLGGYPTNLQEGDVTIDPFGPANSAWLGTLTSSMMPATGQNGLPDSCLGDSGGPLLVRRSHDGAWVVAGITSFGDDCGSESPPAIYTRVYALRRYIYETIYPEMTAYLLSHGQYSLLADTDEDSLPLLAEYAFNADPDNGKLTALPRAGSILLGGQTYVTMTFQRPRQMRSFAFQVEQSAHPDGPWESFAVSPLITSQQIINATSELLTVRAASPIQFRPFVRLTLEPTGSL